MPGATSEDRCPSVVQILERADGGLARLRVPGGRLTPAQLRVVADVAAEHGSGTIEITNRANLQLRGIRPGRGDAVATDLRVAGLSQGGPGDLRRNVLASPLAGLDPDEVADVGVLVDPILAALDAETSLDDLSPKWGVVLDGGGRWALGGRRDDVVVTVVGTARFEVRSLLGRTPTGSIAGVAEAVCAAAVASLGRPRRQVVAPGPGSGPGGGPLGPAVGWAAAMPWLGRLDPASASAVADAADHHGTADHRGTGGIRLTPWRSVVLPGPGAAVAAALGAAGLLVDAGDPATSVVACVGSTGCTSGLTDAPADARAVAGARPTPLEVHVSGCAKRCAHPGPAARTLVAVGRGRYDVLGPDDRPLASGVDTPTAVALAAR